MLWQKAQHTPFIKVENSITKFHSESIKSKKLTVPWTAEAEFTSVGGKKNTHTSQTHQDTYVQNLMAASKIGTRFLQNKIGAFHTDQQQLAQLYFPSFLKCYEDLA